MEALLTFAKGFLPKGLSWLSERIKANNPIEHSVEHFVEDHWCVVFPGAREELRKLEGKKHFGGIVHSNLLKLGAVDYGETRVRLRLRAKTEAPVLIKQITAQATKSAPLEGIRITHPTAGVSDSTLFLVDFDDEGTQLPLWSAVEEGFEVKREGAKPFFSRKQVNLSQAAYETLIVIAKTTRYSVSWMLNIDYEVSGRRGTLQVDNSGLPFRTTGDPQDGHAEDLVWAWYDGHRLLPANEIDIV